MTVNRGPGVAPIAGVGTTTVEHRLQLAGQYAENAPGVPRSGVLTQATDLLVVGRADMSYDVGPAALVISRTAGEGVYTPTLTGTTNVPTDAAPGTNSRWDLIYVKQNDQAKGDADNQAVIGVQKGAAAASPTKPTANLPSGAYVLAEARIFATTTGTSAGSNTVAQVWRHTAARGAPIKVRNLTERAEITTPAAGLTVLRLDLPGVPTDTYDAGGVWRPSTIAGTHYALLDPQANFGFSGTCTVTPQSDGKRKVELDLAIVRDGGGAFGLSGAAVPQALGVVLPDAARGSSNTKAIGAYLNGGGSGPIPLQVNVVPLTGEIEVRSQGAQSWVQGATATVNVTYYL